MPRARQTGGVAVPRVPVSFSPKWRPHGVGGQLGGPGRVSSVVPPASGPGGERAAARARFSGVSRRQSEASVHEQEECCGFGGLFSIKNAEISLRHAGPQARQPHSPPAPTAWSAATSAACSISAAGCTGADRRCASSIWRGCSTSRSTRPRPRGVSGDDFVASGVASRDPRISAHAGIHRGGGSVDRDRRRRQHRDLQRRQRAAAAPAAVPATPIAWSILWNRSPGLGIAEDWFSTAQYFDIKNGHRGFEEVAIAIGGNYNLTGDGEPERDRHDARLVEPAADARAAAPALGRLFTADEDRPGLAGTVMLRHGTWMRRYGSDPVGDRPARSRLNGQPLPDRRRARRVVLAAAGGDADARRRRGRRGRAAAAARRRRGRRPQPRGLQHRRQAEAAA